MRHYNYETVKIGDDWFERAFSCDNHRNTTALCRDKDKAELVVQALNGVETGEIATVDGGMDDENENARMREVINEGIGSRLRKVFNNGE